MLFAFILVGEMEYEWPVGLVDVTGWLRDPSRIYVRCFYELSELRSFFRYNLRSNIPY